MMSSNVIEERAGARYAVTTAQQTLDRLAESVRPSTVFGQPIERGAITIIPCCEIALGMGMGGGGGTSPATNGRVTAAGEGVGAGGGVRGRPVAAIVISRDTVRVEPVIDATKVALAGLTTVGFMALWLARLGRPVFGRRRAIAAKTPPIARLTKALTVARVRRPRG
jgi:uncharacterized spore protein YtfJ